MGRSSWTSYDYGAYAAELRRSLLEKLAPDGRCQKCGKKPRMIDSLQVDHVYGRTWDVTKVNRWTRAKRYWQEFKDGVCLRALCKRCNAGHHPKRMPAPPPPPAEVYDHEYDWREAA